MRGGEGDGKQGVIESERQRDTGGERRERERETRENATEGEKRERERETFRTSPGNGSVCAGSLYLL